MSSELRKTITEMILLKLDRICMFADGYFLTTFILNSKDERAVFSMLKKRNYFWFEEIFIGPKKVYRLTSSYSFNRNIGKIFGSFGKKAIGKRLIWSAHISSENLDIKFNDRLKEKKFAIQGDAEDVIKQAEVVLVSDDILLSDPKNALPKPLQKKSIRVLVQRLFHEESGSDRSEKISVSIDKEDEATQIFYEKYVMPNLLEGGVGVGDEEIFHEDERHYPAIDRPIDGQKKAYYDRLSIERLQYVDGYKFGVEPA